MTQGLLLSMGLLPEDLDRELGNAVRSMQEAGINYDAAIRAFKRLYIVKILDAHRGNQCKAAAYMGVHRNTIRRMMAELNISLREGHEKAGAA